jgi:hypothetical protein
MSLTRLISAALAMGIAIAVVATLATSMTLAGPPHPQSKWPAPFPPRETINRPECWPDIAIMDAGLPRCVRAPD